MASKYFLNRLVSVHYQKFQCFPMVHRTNHAHHGGVWRWALFLFWCLSNPPFRTRLPKGIAPAARVSGAFGDLIDDPNNPKQAAQNKAHHTWWSTPMDLATFWHGRLNVRPLFLISSTNQHCRSTQPKPTTRLGLGGGMVDKKLLVSTHLFTHWHLRNR